MLNMTKVELKQFPHPDMYIFFGEGTRVQVYCISNRYSKANNNYLKSYGSEKESKHIICLDVNNLCGMRCLSFFQQVASNT